MPRLRSGHFIPFGGQVTNLDLANTAFELVGGVLGWRNVIQLVRDRAVQGVYLPLQGFYVTWSLWNLWFYWGVECYASFVGQLFMASATMTWLMLATRYRSKSWLTE